MPIGDRYEDGPVSQTSPSHVGPGDVSDHMVVLVDMVDHLVGAIALHPVCHRSDHDIRTF